MIVINGQVAIPEEELDFTASTSGGPGGQHVNKVSTRVTLWFDVVNSPSLSPDQKDLIMRRLGSRVSKDGVLRIISQETRSQVANKRLTLERFSELLRDALRQVPTRKKTRVGKAAKLRRLQEKKRRSLLKHERSKNIPIVE